MFYYDDHKPDCGETGPFFSVSDAIQLFPWLVRAVTAVMSTGIKNSCLFWILTETF